MGKRLGPARESWIRSSDPDKYAAAMGKCQHGDPSFCSSDGYCNRGGCFVPGGELVACTECKGSGSISLARLKEKADA